MKMFTFVIPEIFYRESLNVIETPTENFGGDMRLLGFSYTEFALSKLYKEAI